MVATVGYEDVDTPKITTNALPSCPHKSKESYLDVATGEELLPEQQTSMKSLLHQYRDIWTDVPGRTNLAQFEVNLNSDVPRQCKPYPLPHTKRSVVQQEVADMLVMEVIEPAWRAHSSPIIQVRKRNQHRKYAIIQSNTYYRQM